MGIFNKVLTAGGNLLNMATGATSAGAQSQKYALQSAEVNHAYQKEFAQNAHQWEVEDLKKAGLNPVLSAGGSGASASGGGVTSASQVSAGINPIETAIGAWQGYENAQNTGADTKRKTAEIDNIQADTLLKQLQQIHEMRKTELTDSQRKVLNAQEKEIMQTLGVKIKSIKAEANMKNASAYETMAMLKSRKHNIETDTKLKRKTKEKMTTTKGGGINLGKFRLGFDVQN